MSSAKVEWTEPMIDALHRLRGEGESLVICAEKIGVTYPNAFYKARELGLSQRMNRGRVPGTARIQQERPS